MTAAAKAFVAAVLLDLDAGQDVPDRAFPFARKLLDILDARERLRAGIEGQEKGRRDHEKQGQTVHRNAILQDPVTGWAVIGALARVIRYSAWTSISSGLWG